MEKILIFIVIILVLSFFFFLGLLMGIVFLKETKTKKGKCDCPDPQFCDYPCNAKKKFKKKQP